MNNGKMSIKNIAVRFICLVLAFVMLFGLASCRKKALDPNERFCLVVKNAVDSSFKNAEAAVSETKEEFTAKNVSVRPRLSDSFIASVGANIPFSPDFLNEATIDILVAKHGKLGKLSASLLHKNSALLTLEGIVDNENDVAYATVDPASKKALKLELAELMELNGLDFTSLKDNHLMTDTNVSDIKAIVDDYLSVILGAVQGVAEEKGTVSAGDLTAETVKLTWSLSDKEGFELVAAISDKLASDERIKNVYFSAFNGTAEEYNELVGELMAYANDAREAAADATAAKGAIVISLHTNKDNELLGLFVRHCDSADGFKEIASLDCVNLSADGTFESILLVDTEDEAPVNISLSGTEARGVASGKVRFSYDGKEVLSVSFSDVDCKKGKEGTVNGTYVLKTGAGLNAVIDVDPMVATMIGMFELSIEAKPSENSSEFNVSVLMNGADFAGLNVIVSDAGDTVVTVPSDFETDVYDWLAEFDLDKLSDAVRNSSLPDDVKQMLSGLFVYG